MLKSRQEPAYANKGDCAVEVRPGEADPRLRLCLFRKDEKKDTLATFLSENKCEIAGLAQALQALGRVQATREALRRPTRWTKKTEKNKEGSPKEKEEFSPRLSCFGLCISPRRSI